MGYLSAGRRAAQTGAGLQITRRNSGWDPVMYELEPGIVYEPDVHAPPEFVSNPFQKVTEPGPGKIQVTSKRGKTLYMTQNQIAKMGDKMLAPGEVERALGRMNPARHRSQMSGEMRARADQARTKKRNEARRDRLAAMSEDAAYEAAMYEGGMYNNPRYFRGVKQAQSPAERKHASLMRRHGGKSLTHLLVHSQDPEEQEAGARIERQLSRKAKKAEGTYGSVRDEVPGAYDETEFQRHMAQLGIKGNPRRR
jgi:hypothetical protein